MKKYLFLILLSALICCFSACNSEPNSDSIISSSINNESSDDIIVENSADEEDYFIENDTYSSYIYSEHYFADYFTYDEFIELETMAAAMSAELRYAISKDAILIHQNIATYNSSEDTYLVVDKSGKTITDYGDNSLVANYFINMGDYSFLKTKADPAMFDIVNSKGVVVNTFKSSDTSFIDYRKDLGNGYCLFTNTLTNPKIFTFYILNPDGNYYHLQKFPNKDYNVDLFYSSIDEDVRVGCVSEDMFYVLCSNWYGTYRNTFAVYYNTKGERVIDLSTIYTNYDVMNLSDFKNGQAEIYFFGADDKFYKAVISSTGEFIEEPHTI